MNVLIVPSWYPDKNTTDWGKGEISGSFFLEQAKEINSKANVQVIYVMIHSLRKLKLKKIFSLFSFSWSNEDGIRTVRLNTFNFFPKSSRALVFQYKLYARVIFFFLAFSKKFKPPEIVHCHSPFFGGVIAMYASKKFNAKLIFTEHSRQHPNYILPYENMLYKKIIENSTRVIALSRDFVNFLSKDQDVPLKKISIVPNMIPRFCLDHTHKKEAYERIFKFIFVGSLIDLKRPLDLLQAFHEIDHEKYNCHLKIIGKGYLYKQCNDFIIKHDLGEKVSLLGELSRAETIFNISRSSCLCSVSSTESFGLSILEAQSFGLPVISTRSGGPEDLINKHNGMIVEVGNIYQIKNAMMKIIDDKENYDSTKIRHACLKKYHPEVITEELIDIYRKMISSRRL